MQDIATSIWQQGFTAGAMLPGHRCPYADRTPEARSWLLGWAQGIHKYMGREYKESPHASIWSDGYEDNSDD